MNYLIPIYSLMTIMVFCYVLYRFVMKKIPVGSTIYGSPKYTERVNPYKDHIYVFCLGGVVMNILFFKNISNLFPEYSFWIMGISIVIAIVFVGAMEYTFKMQTPLPLAEKYDLEDVAQVFEIKPEFKKRVLTERQLSQLHDEYVSRQKLIVCSVEDIDFMLRLKEPVNKILLIKPTEKNKNYMDKSGLLGFADMLFNFKEKQINRDSIYLFMNKYFEGLTNEYGAKSEITRKNIDDYLDRIE